MNDLGIKPEILLQMSGTHKLCSLHVCHRTSLIDPTVPVYSSRNERLERLVTERRELDNAMSWLSTLGGAFSALGEEFKHCVSMLHKLLHSTHWGLGKKCIQNLYVKFIGKDHLEDLSGYRKINIKSDFRETVCEGLNY